MRKVFAIAMLFAYLFNLAGYNLFFRYSISQANSRFVHELDQDHYSDAQLVEVKIKLNMPYMNDWALYERFDGEIEVGGTHYNYVKRKLAQDTLYLLCVPNEVKNALVKEKNSYVVHANDLPAGKNEAGTAKKSASVDESNQQLTMYDFALTDISTLSHNQFLVAPISNPYAGSTGKPPKAAVCIA